MPPRKRKRADTAASSSTARTIALFGGLPCRPRTIDKFRTGQMCDVRLCTADGREFHAHALVLMAASEYMEALLAGDWSDASGPLTLSAVPGAALQACLEFIYTGEVAVADEAALATVLEAAAYLQIPDLVEAAAKAMSERLCPATALMTWGVAERLGIGVLVAKAQEAAAKHFIPIVASDGWLNAPIDHVCALLSADKLGVGDEAVVYDAALAWLRARSPPLGAEEAAALLGLVRYPLLARDFYQQTVRKEPLLDTLPGAKMLSDAFAASAYGDLTCRRIFFEASSEGFDADLATGGAIISEGGKVCEVDGAALIGSPIKRNMGKHTVVIKQRSRFGVFIGAAATAASMASLNSQDQPSAKWLAHWDHPHTLVVETDAAGPLELVVFAEGEEVYRWQIEEGWRFAVKCSGARGTFEIVSYSIEG